MITEVRSRGDKAWKALLRAFGLSWLFCLLLCQCTGVSQVQKQQPVSRENQSRWERVTPRLAAAVPMDRKGKSIAWKFAILPAAGRNARSWPDGRVEVTEGLLRFVKNDAELAAVLAHEMAHVILRHGRARTAASWAVLLGSAALAVAVNSSDDGNGWKAAGAAAGAVSTISLTALSAFHRHQEFAADKESVSILLRADYPARAAADFWERYAAGRMLEGRKGGGWWRSHPPDAERVRRLRKLAEEH